MLRGDEVALGRGAVAGELRLHTVHQERLGRERRTQSGSSILWKTLGATDLRSRMAWAIWVMASDISASG